ncbi:hypothetical protein [Gluconacetobacter diazotrophicus]|uniref:hypothetical protein n=1 Tax=Gluconacetobacter diazotrophicus TaxID=33996 RepID=UPI00059B9B29|nr:hypothetical protein [Gluconacetobacter diazotrophicus]
MTEQQRDNSGALFLNSRRQSDKAPDYTGTLVVNGQSLEISAWVRDGRSGEFLSLKVQEKRQTPPRSGARGSYPRRPGPREVERAEADRAKMLRGL